jgi:nitrite reductase/ring-hydroxylating ferredoxin subunit
MAHREKKEREEHLVGAITDFPEGSHKVVKVGRREIGIFNVGGRLYGLPNLCPHQTGPLCEGRRRDRGLSLARPRVLRSHRQVHSLP